MIKKFKDFIYETYLDEPANLEFIDFNKKKMEKNGYTKVIVDIPVEGVKKGDEVYVSATEYGQLSDDSIVTCIVKNNKTIIIPKRNLKIEDIEDDKNK